LKGREPSQRTGEGKEEEQGKEEENEGEGGGGGFLLAPQHTPVYGATKATEICKQKKSKLVHWVRKKSDNIVHHDPTASAQPGWFQGLCTKRRLATIRQAQRSWKPLLTHSGFSCQKRQTCWSKVHRVSPLEWGQATSLEGI
jgi:hypothetical protein